MRTSGSLGLHLYYILLDPPFGGWASYSSTFGERRAGVCPGVVPATPVHGSYKLSGTNNCLQRVILNAQLRLITASASAGTPLDGRASVRRPELPSESSLAAHRLTMSVATVYSLVVRSISQDMGGTLEGSVGPGPLGVRHLRRRG